MNHTKYFAKQLRKNLTEAEKRLWFHLRGRQMEGMKFRRQAPIGPYIADFVCFSLKLILEIDGSQHAESSYDMIRDRWLKKNGFTVIRFWNNEVFENMEGVLEIIKERLSRVEITPTQPPP